jgi:hypothetical protein
MAQPIGAVTEFLINRFGGLFDVKESTVSVGTAVAVIALGSVDRTTLTIVNHGAADIFVAPTGRVAATWGIRIFAGGGFLTMNVDEDGILPTLTWYAISGGLANTVYVNQVVREHIVKKE